MSASEWRSRTSYFWLASDKTPYKIDDMGGTFEAQVWKLLGHPQIDGYGWRSLNEHVGSTFSSLASAQMACEDHAARLAHKPNRVAEWPHVSKEKPYGYSE